MTPKPYLSQILLHALAIPRHIGHYSGMKSCLSPYVLVTYCCLSLAYTGWTQGTAPATNNPAPQDASVRTNAPAPTTHTAAPAAVPPGSNLVYVIPVQGMIERGLLHVVRRSIQQAVEQEATALILDMDTPGGRVDVTESIMRLLLELPAELQTYTFINKDALSAGALIAISTETIYMAPGSRIGASAIVTSSGDIEEGDMKEKHVSALVALVRTTAEAHGHDPDLIESMIRRDISYEIDGETIVKEGQLLTLSERDATRMVYTNTPAARPILAQGIVSDLSSLLDAAGIENPDIRTIEVTLAERIARWIETFAFLFLAGGLLGLYIEFRTPGFGFPGLAGGVLLAFFFWGHRIAGLSGDLELILFILGVCLLLLELFVIPGFGLPGIAGITLMLIAIFFSMAAPIPGGPWFRIPTINLQWALLQLGLACGISLILGGIAARFLPRTSGFQRLVLSDVLSGNAATPLAPSPTAPATSKPPPAPPLVGATGTAITALHPSGYARIQGQRLNVVAEGSYMDAGDPVRVIAVQGYRVVVGALPHTDETRKPS